MLDISSHDVLLVGGGGAGLRAAIAVSETNPSLSVAVVSKVYPMRSHTVAAEGGAAGVHLPDDSLDEHAYDTISGGDWLCDQDAVEAFVKEAPEELMRLEHWGCPWSREPDGRIAVRPFGGMKKTRTWFAADKTGFHMLHTLFQTSLKYDAVTRYDEYFVTRLLVDDGRVQGVVALELTTGKIQAITAKAVILCTGGCGRVFRFTTNAAIKTGDGMALAYRAGAPLKDMEFVQYHPTGLPFTGILITEAARAEGGYLLNKDGYRYLQDYNLGTPEPKPVLRSMELGPRDRLSQAFVREQEKGRTVEGPYGSVVNLDLRHLGEKTINTKLPFVRELCLKYENIDPITAVDSGAPRGSLHDGRRSYGSERGHAAEGFVRGRRGRLRQHQRRKSAGFEFAAGAARIRRQSRARSSGLCGRAEIPWAARAWPRRWTSMRGCKNSSFRRAAAGSASLTLREEMQKIMEQSAGIYRSGESLSGAAGKLHELQDRFRDIRLDDRGHLFNTELISALELSCMLEVAETMAQCAMERTESRGAHQRTDYPARNDEKFLAHSLVYRDRGRTAPGGIRARDHHSLATGRAGLTGR